MQLPIHHHKTRDIHEMICLNADKYKINRGDADVDLQKIKMVVLRYFGISDKDFCSESRLEILVKARNYYCGLAKFLTRLSLSMIGQGMGGRHYSTVIHGSQRLSDMISIDKKSKQVYENMKSELLGKPIPYPDNYTYNPQKKEYRSARQIELQRQRSFEVEDKTVIDHSKNNNGYSFNHDKIYQ